MPPERALVIFGFTLSQAGRTFPLVQVLNKPFQTIWFTKY